MTKIHAKRLLKLATFLRTLPTDNFDMYNWFSESECGTSGCILGWATTIEDFKRIGFTRSSWGNNCPSFTPTIAFDKKSINYFNLMGTMAGCVFFGLTIEEGQDLFQGTFQTPKQAATAIKKLVRGYHPQLLLSPSIK